MYMYIWLDFWKPCQYFETITHVHFDFTTPEGLKTNASDQKKKKKKIERGEQEKDY